MKETSLLPNLFSHLSIGSLVLKNRIVMAPMATGLFEEGKVTPEARAFYLRRAKGGVGTIIVGGVYVTWPKTADASSIGRHAHIMDDSIINPWKDLIEEIHQYGTQVGVQLFHPGRQVNAAQWGEQPVAPSSLRSFGIKGLPKELTEAEIKELVQIFGKAARRAQQAGFDFIEIHGAHGYLISSFLSLYSNKREDQFGGNAENRSRFAQEIIRTIKDDRSIRNPVGIRINGRDNIEEGNELKDTQILALIFEKAGVDFLDISAGVYGSHPALIPMGEPQGCFVPLAASIREVVGVPVIGVGLVKDPLFADEMIREKKVDLIALGRSLIADPNWSEKAAKGDFQNIRKCISCNQGCADRIEQINFYGQPVSITCFMNFEVGEEQKYPPRAAVNRKRILVIGGGPAGLTASRVAAQRGHQVTLIEREKELGGQLRLAGVLPVKQGFNEAIVYMSQVALQVGVIIKTGLPFNQKLIAELEPDIVIVATGARPLVPSIIGHRNKNVVTAHEVLSGRARTGDQVLIIGGGLVGLETADYLSSQGKKVFVAEMTNRFGSGIGSIEWMNLSRRLRAKEVKLLKSCEVKEIQNDRARIIGDGGEEMIREINTFVLAVGVVPQTSVYAELKSVFRNVYLIGDAAQPRNALWAIHDGVQLSHSF